MSYCSTCGANVDGLRYCENCGTQVEEVLIPQPAPVYQGMNARQQTMAELARLKDYFGQMHLEYLEKDMHEEQIQQCREKKYTGLILPAIITGLVGYGLFTTSSGVFLARIIFSFGLPIGLITAFILLTKKNKDKLAQSEARYRELEMELKEHYHAFGCCPIGFDYTHPYVLDRLEEIVRDGFASTLEGALIQMRNEDHMRNLEEQAIRTTTAAEKAAENARQANINAQAAKDAAWEAKQEAKWNWR